MRKMRGNSLRKRKRNPLWLTLSIMRELLQAKIVGGIE
jgi:hypothetical protein